MLWAPSIWCLTEYQAGVAYRKSFVPFDGLHITDDAFVTEMISFAQSVWCNPFDEMAICPQ